MIDPASWDELYEQVILLFRFGALLGFLVLLGGLLSHSRWVKAPDVRRAYVALGALWGGFGYIQIVAIWGRLAGTPAAPWVGVSTAVMSFIVAGLCTWAFWPWRGEA